MEKTLGSNCLFCKIASGELPATVVHSDDDFMAFKDIQPQAPVHLLLIPRKHITSLSQCREENALLLGKMLLAAGELAHAQGISEQGYRININTGQKGGQTVSHLHIHLLGGRQMMWPPG